MKPIGIDPLESRRHLAGYIVDEAFAEKVLADPAYGYMPRVLGPLRDGSIITLDLFAISSEGHKYSSDGTPDAGFVQRYIRVGQIQEATIDVADRIVLGYPLQKPAEAIKGIELRRVRSDGLLDPTFNGDGVARLLTPPGWRARDVTFTSLATDSLGNTLALVQTPDGPVVQRLTPRGKADLSYGENGFASIPHDADLRGASIEIVNGRTFVTLSIVGKIQVVALTPNGKVDRPYGRNGVCTLPTVLSDYFKHPPITRIDGQGRVYVAVYRQIVEWYDPPLEVPAGVVVGSVARFLPDGTLDPTFGNAGYAALKSPGGIDFEQMADLVIDSQSRIWVASAYYSVARLLPDGAIDKSFDFDGYFDSYHYEPQLLPAGESLFEISGNGELRKLITGKAPIRLEDKTLIVSGGSDGNTIDVREINGRVVIRVDGFAPVSVRKSAIRTIDIRLSQRDDVLTYDSTKTLKVDASSGDDRLVLLSGSHEVETGGGDDTVLCGAGTDIISNYSGHDTIDLGAGAGSVRTNYRSSASDESQLYLASATIRAQPGDESVEILSGAAGDIVHIVGGRVKLVDDGGINRITIDSLYGASIQMGDFFDYDPIYKSRNFISTGSGDDTIFGSRGFDYISSGAGRDRITNPGGSGVIVAGAGNDTIIGSGKPETLNGGSGTDSASVGDDDVVSEIELLTGA